jgi:hypothetical protein
MPAQCSHVIEVNGVEPRQSESKLQLNVGGKCDALRKVIGQTGLVVRRIFAVPGPLTA